MIGRRTTPALRLLTGLVGAILLTACSDEGPEGPGTLRATLSGPAPMGAVVVELTGPGISGIRGSGTRVFSGEVGSEGTTHRVVVVGESPGRLAFDIDVADLGDRPRVTVLEAVDGANEPFPALGQIDVDLDPR